MLNIKPIVENVAYKIVSSDTWENFLKSGRKRCYGFSKDFRNGYISLYREEQLHYANKGLSNSNTNLNIICVDLDLSHNVKWVSNCVNCDKKYSYNYCGSNCEFFPRLYGYMSFDKNIRYVRKYNGNY